MSADRTGKRHAWALYKYFGYLRPSALGHYSEQSVKCLKVRVWVDAAKVLWALVAALALLLR